MRLLTGLMTTACAAEQCSAVQRKDTEAAGGARCNRTGGMASVCTR
jgi:hypothetical protein